MEVKLIKTEVNYLLENEKGVVIASTSLKKEGLSLSLKNCQAIELGYDLGELANERSRLMSLNSMFKAGFQKALSILGDKKFSEEDVRKAFVDAFQKCYEVINSGKFDDITSAIEWLTQTNADNYIQSLQQTEWDVEVEMKDSIALDGHTIIGTEPTLDTDGCLRLKRI